MKKQIWKAFAFVCVLALVLGGCGSKAAGQPSAETAPFGMEDITLTTSTWSSPNGATVHLRAVPASYAKGQSASFRVTLAGAEIASIPCTWDGTAFTADAELNAADGFSYAVLFTDELGVSLEIPLDAPEALVNMASGLQSYCTLLVEETAFENSKLTITKGLATVRRPGITNEGEVITVTEGKLMLTKNGQEVASVPLNLAPDASELALSGLSLEIPTLENDQEVVLSLQVTLSNGHVLQAEGGSFYYIEGELTSAVG